jgi:hypothetical protein
MKGLSNASGFKRRSSGRAECDMHGSPVKDAEISACWIMPRHPRHAVRFLIAIALLVLTSLPVRRNHVGPLEAHVFHLINGLPQGLYPLLWTVMQLGNVVAAPALAVIALVFRKLRLAVDLALAGGGAWLLARSSSRSSTAVGLPDCYIT